MVRAAAPARVRCSGSIGQRCAMSERNIKKVGYIPGVADDIMMDRPKSMIFGLFRSFSLFF